MNVPCVLSLHNPSGTDEVTAPRRRHEAHTHEERTLLDPENRPHSRQIIRLRHISSQFFFINETGIGHLQRNVFAGVR